MADYFYILRYRQMQFVGKGDPDHYSYKEVAKSTDRQFINSIIEKYRLKMVNPKEYIDDGYEYDLISSDKGRQTYKGKYSEFVYQPDEEGNPPEDKFGWEFLEYCDENIGCEYYEEPYESEYDDDEDEESAEEE